MSEKDLIQSLQRGDQRAFSAFIDLYQDRVYSCAIGIVQQEQDAEDIAQEVFIEVYRSIVNFKSESSLSTWIYRITINKAVDFQKKKHRKKRFGFLVPLWGNDNEQNIEIPDFRHPGIDLEHQELSNMLFKAVNKLPERQKVAFILNKLEHKNYQEISAIMELTLSSVESLLFRAKKNLQEYLTDYHKI